MRKKDFYSCYFTFYHVYNEKFVFTFPEFWITDKYLAN